MKVSIELCDGTASSIIFCEILRFSKQMLPTSRQIFYELWIGAPTVASAFRSSRHASILGGVYCSAASCPDSRRARRGAGRGTGAHRQIAKRERSKSADYRAILCRQVCSREGSQDRRVSLRQGPQSQFLTHRFSLVLCSLRLNAIDDIDACPDVQFR